MQNRLRSLLRAGVTAFAAAGLVAAAAPQLEAQSRERPSTRSRTQPRPPQQRPAEARPQQARAQRARAGNPLAGVRSRSLARGGYAVVVDLDENLLHFARGRRVLWSAPVGTGTGVRLEHGRGEWDFATPNGTFHVTYKQIEPDWIAPDWYFIENGLRVPPAGSDARRFPRGLGAAGVFIGHGLAIHGTDKPELLGQRVSHGCIRLSNANALRLFHNVQVGTEIIIVGGRNAQPAEPPRQTASSSRRSGGGPPPRDAFIVELEGARTDDLLERLDDELFSAVAGAGARSRWHQFASVLLLRGVKEDDDEALEGLLARGTELGTGRLRDEYATFIADAFVQGPLRVLEVMGGMQRDERGAVARAMVESSIGLYPGDPGSVSAPWPTRRAPRTAVRRGGQRAWDALQDAENDHRERMGLAVR